MIFIQYLIRPTPLNEAFSLIGGAYANCYINTDDRDLAERKCKAKVREYHWDIENCEKIEEFEPDEDESDENVKQALIDDEVYVFHSWPISTDDDEKID
jgi:hypothetical protein